MKSPVCGNTNPFVAFLLLKTKKYLEKKYPLVKKTNPGIRQIFKKKNSEKRVIMFTEKDLNGMRNSPRAKDMFAHLVQSLKLGKPVVSVGSGNGTTEALARVFFMNERPPRKKKMMPPEIIGVDPKPQNYYPASPEIWETFSVKPSFATVSDLVINRPELVGKCVMWLIWAPYFLEFDMEALVLLQPTHIVIHTDLMGTACSPSFNRWLSKGCGIPTRWKNFEIAGSKLKPRDCGVKSFSRLGARLMGEVIECNELGPDNAPVTIKNQNRLLASLYLVDPNKCNALDDPLVEATFDKGFHEHLVLMFCNNFNGICVNCNSDAKSR